MTENKKIKVVKFEKELEEVCSKIRELVSDLKDQKHVAMKAYYVFLNESKTTKEEVTNE